MLDWAFYLKYLQFILLEFDADGALGKPTMIKSFQKSLKPSIQAKIEQRSCKLDSSKELIEKTVNVKAKAAFRPYFATHKIYQDCLWNIQSANFIIAKSKGSFMKNPRVEEPKPKTQEAISFHRSKNAETFNKAWKKIKDQCCQGWQPQKSSTLAIGVNVAESGKPNKKKNKD